MQISHTCLIFLPGHLDCLDMRDRRSPQVICSKDHSGIQLAAQIHHGADLDLPSFAQFGDHGLNVTLHKPRISLSRSVIIAWDMSIEDR